MNLQSSGHIIDVSIRKPVFIFISPYLFNRLHKLLYNMRIGRSRQKLNKDLSIMLDVLVMKLEAIELELKGIREYLSMDTEQIEQPVLKSVIKR